jgi:hypothetical protein
MDTAVRASVKSEGAAKLRGAARRVLLTIVECVVVVAFVAMMLEGLSRLIHLGKRPMIPIIMDAHGAPRMPPGFASTVQFPTRAPFEICTDKLGLRTPHCGMDEPPQELDVLSVGDSQALGWGLDFPQTYTALVASGLRNRRTGDARIMAAAATDVERLQSWAQEYRQSTRAKPLLNIVTLNLGNDLDEMFFSRATVVVPRFQAFREWLSVHSVFMLDFAILKNTLSHSEWQTPPGANPVLFALDDDERETLARATANSVERLVRILPEARNTVVLILPNDYQVAPSEFDKYRKFYPLSEQFESWQRRMPQAVKALDSIEVSIAGLLRERGLRVALPAAQLKKQDPLRLFDRGSHHFSPLGQQILARSILEALDGEPTTY